MKYPDHSCSFPEGWDPPAPPGQFLMQRILARGKTHRRCSPDALCYEVPCDARIPVTVTEVSLCGAATWEEQRKEDQGFLTLCVSLPLAVTLRDSCGRCFTVPARLEDEVRLRLCCRREERWQGTVQVLSAVRLCKNACSCAAFLEICLEAFLVSPCAVGAPCPSSCPPPKPWYPQPGFDPYK